MIGARGFWRAGRLGTGGLGEHPKSFRKLFFESESGENGNRIPVGSLA